MKIWYSAAIETSCVDEGGHVVVNSKSVWIFQSGDFDDAFQVALKIGHSQEESYENGNGVMVEWKFVRVSFLESIEMSATSPVEVHHEFDEHLKGEKFDSSLEPEGFRPDLE